MRFHWLRARAFVHATEDEARVLEALLRLLGLAGDPKGRDRVSRQRAKGHYGNDIVVLEGSLKRDADVEATMRRVLENPGVRAAVRDTLLRRLDEDDVLHIRLDKQTLVQGRHSLTEGSDAVVVTAKAALQKGELAPKAWATFLDGGPAPV